MSLQDGEHTRGGAESGVLGEGMAAPNPFPMPCPIHSFNLTIPELHLLQVRDLLSKYF